MLNTKNMTVGSGKVRPLMGPGNRQVRINQISFDKTPYDSDAYNVNLHMETKPIGGDFEGFFRNKDNESEGRYEGQIGRVRISPYPYKDTTLPSGREISRDQEVLKSMIFLGEVLDKRDELDSIEAETIEDFMKSVNNVLVSDTWFNVCLASREWENKEGYINNDLYLPKLSRDGVPAEELHPEGDNSRLIQFDPAIHIKPVIRKEPEQAKNFEPATTGKSDFEL
jgi:hypothetical protein